jgi:glycosyltransferase involved in cell wall biosynthesis
MSSLALGIRRLLPATVKRRLRRWLGSAPAALRRPPRCALDPLDVSRLGVPSCRGAQAPPGGTFSGWLVQKRPELAPVGASGGGGEAMITVCTRNHLFFARALVSSYRRHHLEADCHVVIADWDGRDPEAVEISGAATLSGRALVGEDFDFLALKYSAADLCCALKPYGIEYLMRGGGYERILYLDSDIYVFAPLAAFEEHLARHDFVVTPHVVAPQAHPERFWERPSLGDLAYAGVLNAGMAGMRVNSETRRFIETWRLLVTAPGAFLATQGGQMEQNAFNWVTCFAADVHVLQDTTYNVAYWNLHDRSLRWRGLDGPETETWDVDGRPLSAYHFSGYSPYAPRAVSRHDQRHSLFLMPSLARLFEFYRRELERHGAEALRGLPYGFSAFPSGVPIDDRMRFVFKEHETFLRCEASPWSAEGEAHYAQALLSPVPYTGTLVPVLFERIYAQRADLQTVFPEAPLQPQGLSHWVAVHGVKEYGYQRLFDRHRPALPTLPGAAEVVAAIRERPELAEGLAAPLGVDRTAFIERLRDAGRRTLAEAIDKAHNEHYHASPIATIRQIHAERADLQAAFPDPLGDDAGALAAWLSDEGAVEYFLTPESVEVFRRKTRGRGMARVFSYFTRNWNLMAAFPLAFVGPGHRELARALMSGLRHGLEYDLDDVLAFVWTMETTPWAGLALTLELSYNAVRRPSPFLPEGQELLLAPVLAGDVRFRKALEEYRHRYPPPASLVARPNSGVKGAPRVLVSEFLESEMPAPAPAGPAPPGLVAGVNLFGFHKSPIGLGSLTHGLHQALGECGLPVRANLLGNVAMDPNLEPADFLRRHDDRFDTNIFVSYPHLEVVLPRTVPEHVVRGRRNIVYLAWEQRDGSHYWAQTLADFEQIWALSEFAAQALRRVTGRAVLTVPSVVDFDSFPEPATKSEVGLDPALRHFLYVFDANSSIERKNPEAAIRAFAAAFSPSDPVRLIMKVSNSHRLEHRERLRRILRASPDWLEPIFIVEDMARRDLLRLISAVDCYVSLHRAEGFGYTCAEAMAYAKPVVATAYSGNLQFMDRANSMLVDYRETAVEKSDGPFQRGSVWAEADVEHAAELMRRVYANPEEAGQVGARGRATVREKLSAATVGALVREALGTRPDCPSSAPGPPVLTKARSGAG